MSKDVRRDDALDRMIETMPAAPPAHGSAECLDAERLAAWADGGLPVEQARAVEAHLADCAGCQALMAAFARAVPEPARATKGVSAWRWMVPVAASALAASLIVWVVWPRTRATAPSAVSVTAQAPAPAAANPLPAPATTSTEAARPANEVSQTAGPLSRRAATATAPAPAAMPAPPPSAPASAPIAASVPPAAPTTDAKTAPPPPPLAAARLPATSAASPPVPVAAAPPPPGMRSDLAAAGARSDRLAAAQDIVGQRAGLLPSDSIAAEFSSPAAAQAGLARGGSGRAAVIGGASPAAPSAPVVHWRVLVTGQVLRAAGTDTSWTPVVLDAPAGAITGGAAPTPNICWLIGHAGLVLRSTDGLHFARVAFPVSVDLVSITAEGDHDATVATADGRVYRTTDAGATWRVQEPPSPSF